MIDTFSGSSDLYSLILMSHLQSVFMSNESLFRNVTFGLNMGNDEIGFRLRVFRTAPDLAPSGTV
jgi:hypothetical protein